MDYGLLCIPRKIVTTEAIKNVNLMEIFTLKQNSNCVFKYFEYTIKNYIYLFREK